MTYEEEPSHECNHCILRRLRKKAEGEGKTVSLIPGPVPGEYGLAGGFDVYIHEAKEEAGSIDDWSCWFMSIGEACECS